MGESLEQQNKPSAKALKVRFKMNEDNLAGALLVLIHPSGDVAATTFVLITNEDTYLAATPTESWQKFAAFCNNLSSLADAEQSGDIAQQIKESIDGYQVSQDILSEDKDSADSSLRDIFEKALKVSCAECEIEIEDVQDFSGALPQGDSGEDNRPEIEKTANLVLDATLVISPVRGKYIQEIIPGDLMKVVLLKKDEVTKKVAKALKALNEEGDYIPVKGRVRQKLPSEKGGYIIYCVIAKNILAKIVEEENIKAELYLQDVAVESKSTFPKMIIYAGVTAVLIITIALALLFLL